MENLNPQQRKVVLHYGRPLLVIAGAGSGKTTTLAHKVSFLLNEKRIPPDRILCATFTNKASKDIAQKVGQVTGKNLKWVGTFHSIALRLLKEIAREKIRVLDESDAQDLMKEVCDPKDIPTLKRALATLREDLRSLQEERESILVEAYREKLKELSLVDFGEILYSLFLRLSQDTAFRNEVKKLFDFILIDEYQDTNTVQYEILKLIASRNVCAVGDPNQCIYEWRFARPENIVRFIKDFNPDVVKLEINYRSGSYILSVANAVLKASKSEWKDLVPTLRSSKGLGEKPLVRRFSNPREEALWIATQVKDLLKDYKPSQIAVLVRASFITDPLEEAFFKSGVPYRVVGALKFFERAEVKNLVSFLRLLRDPYEEVTLKRVCKVFLKGVSEKSLEKVRIERNSLKKLKLLAKLSGQRSDVWEKLEEFYENRENYPEVIKEFVERVRYREIIEKTFKDKPQERWQNVEEFIRTAEELKAEGYSLEEFLDQIYLMGSQDEDSEAIRIMTIHASKGLEFDVVFIPRLEEGILPHRSATESLEELEEERRIFYVALTRAKSKLFLSYTKAKDTKPSRFLSEIPKNLLDLRFFRKEKTSYGVSLKPTKGIKVGDLVKHKVFGVGRVLSVNGQTAEVEFRNKVKRIHSAFLEPIG